MHNWVRASSSDLTGAPPQPRSGHTAVNVGESMVVVFGGLVDKKFLNDIIVYDIDIWQWSELTSFGDLPTPRDFSAAAAIGNQKIVLCGGWDGKKWLSDVYVMDTMSLEWMELSVSGSLPPPRCGHTATMVEKRLLVFGGRGGGGPIMGDLWALKGLIDEERETPGWTQLKLPGQAPSARCGHTVTSGGHYVCLFQLPFALFGSAYRRLPISNDEPPPPRAYHTMTSIGARHLLIGGFDGKSTFGDLWWLVPEDDPIAKRSSVPQLRNPPETKESERDLDTMAAEALRQHWKESTPETLQLKELNALLRDYQRLVTRKYTAQSSLTSTDFGLPGKQTFTFYHIKTSSELRMDDIPKLLEEYKTLVI
uniref:Uncharacterized protein n=1 Tax=Brassica campestris TaxID=3711 RepID=M4FIB6_BRACM